jgi:hemerythrin-like domain-containing protein
MNHALSRRAAFVSVMGVAAGAALILPGCSDDKADEGVSATEDMMREHGVLRRIIVVYRESASMLRGNPADFDAAALGRAAGLFRTFGEDYHERKLEEQHVFPAVQKLGGEAADLVRPLLDQHNRGREMTAFLQSKCAGGKIAGADAPRIAQALESFTRMYEAHTAFEDTIVFQAWRKSLSEKQRDEAGEQFERIERDQFKGDGFDIAVEQVAQIERSLGLHDLAHYTAPPISVG